MTAPRAPLAALLLFVALSPARGAEPNAELRPARDGVPAAVVVTGIEKRHLTALAAAKLTADEWPRVARLVVDEGTPEEVAKKRGIAGVWAVTDDGLRFEPLFPLVPGTKYRLFVAPGAAPRVKITAASFERAMLLPKPPPGPRVSVAGVFPSANRLPENTLRFYVQFSGPVSRAATYRHIKLIRDDGRQVLTPFLEIDEQLWSPDGTRLTLLFDPGRVKRGLKPREEDGPILEEGRRYTFEIDAAWEDVDGRPLTAKFTKAFSVAAPDDEPVWPEDWALMPPRAGSDAPLIIRLAKPLDRALLARLLSVRDATGKSVEGVVTVGGGERVVTFAPARAWGRGEYKLIVDARLEDVCGNRVGEPFELDVLKPIPERAVTKVAERPFAVK
ncbi:hypothetical protein R5W23_001042 [Gemmata sp. JC673]|uniref:SbsA Ig-like domain-containing protein n=1 Tax=Gemmata algarum TaxID=2975278 RepID=A0ABU5EX85_9BACT|nr:hypothetical protein [Gemmata algarum]MDY3559870.1 hypothetical protein [Gemmata algarum]